MTKNVLPAGSVFHDVRAVIFDLDGTLIDSLDIWNTVDVRLISELGHAPLTRAELCSFRDKTLVTHAQEANPYVGFCADLGKICRSPLSGAEIHRMRHRISRQLLREEMRYRLGVTDVVRRLRELGIQTAIATTTKRANIEVYDTQNPVMMKELRLSENFPLILTREDVHSIKPNPEIYLRALAELDLIASDCLVFEDSLVGVSAARAAGIPICSIEESWSSDDLPTIRNLVLKHFCSWAEVFSELVESKSF